MTAECYNAILSSPLGSPSFRVGLVMRDQCLQQLDLMPPGRQRIKPSTGATRWVVDQLNHYFESADWPLKMPMYIIGTDYQKKVWRALQSIPVRLTCTYSQVAAGIGSSPRAVGNACRRNPIPIVIPCHRVVSKAGLGGFAGQTDGFLMDIKTWLLEHDLACRGSVIGGIS